MISHFEATLSQLSVHKIGNKQHENPLVLSEHSLVIQDEVLTDLLVQFFLSSFEKTNQYYQFFHPSEDLELNEVFHFSKKIFDTVKTFHKNSTQLAKHLYDISNHPNIKDGELYAV